MLAMSPEYIIVPIVGVCFCPFTILFLWEVITHSDYEPESFCS